MNNLITNFNLELAMADVLGLAEGESATQKQKLEAWAYLISTSEVWSKKRHIKNQAIELIESGLISDEGEINWDVYEELRI